VKQAAVLGRCDARPFGELDEGVLHQVLSEVVLVDQRRASSTQEQVAMESDALEVVDVINGVGNPYAPRVPVSRAFHPMPFLTLVAHATEHFAPLAAGIHPSTRELWQDQFS
jgi:hypothetical protein